MIDRIGTEERHYDGLSGAQGSPKTIRRLPADQLWVEVYDSRGMRDRDNHARTRTALSAPRFSMTAARMRKNREESKSPNPQVGGDYIVAGTITPHAISCWQCGRIKTAGMD